MKWTPGTENDDVIDVRGASGGGGGGGGFGGMALGGGGVIAALVVVVISRVIGVDLSGLFHSGGHQSAAPTNQPPTGPDSDAELKDYVKFVLKDIQDNFEAMFKQQGLPYRHAKLVLFTGSIDTGCGRSSSAIGPFYCPPDERAYIDLSFYRELRDRFHADGNFAQAYVLAHEIGHHLQKLFGAESKVRKTGGTKNQQSVRIELQADCYAGVWGHTTQKHNLLEAGDVEKALNAAAQIGDDRLQRGAGRTVNPETFTHGTSEQRMHWFKRGFDSGQFDACDTMSGSI